MYQNIEFLRRCHEPYVIIASGDCVYKLDYNKVLDYHIEKKADVTVVCKDMPADMDIEPLRCGKDERGFERSSSLRRNRWYPRSNTISTRNLCAAQETADRNVGALP